MLLTFERVALPSKRVERWIAFLAFVSVIAASSAFAAGQGPSVSLTGNGNTCTQGGGGGSYLVSNTTLNPEVACCLYGWWEPVGGAGQPAGFTPQRLDCTETPAGLNDFDDLYFYCQAVPGNHCSTSSTSKHHGRPGGGTDGVERPFQVYLRDTTPAKTPIPGFYDPASGQRCKFLSTLTAQDELDIIDAASLPDPVTGQRAMPNPVTSGIAAQCTRLVRVAMTTVCPPVSAAVQLAGGNWVVQNIATSPTTTRCTAALSMTFHISILDLNDPTKTKRGGYHQIFSYPVITAGGVTNADYIAATQIFYWKLQQYLHAAPNPPQCGAGSTCANSSCTPGMLYDATQSRCFIKP